MPDPMEPSRRPDAKAASVSLERALERARWAILWERLWPPLAALVTVIGLFLAVSWLGLWLWLPPMGRGLGLFVFFALLAPTMVRALLFVRFPSRHDGLRRLDRVSGIAHRPATTIADEMATSQGDAWSKALWRAHVEQALARVRNLKAGLPLPRLSVRDPFALRALVLILAVATFFAAGGERGRRIAAAFDWQGVVVPPNFRLDAWVLPPAYTSKPPVILPGVRPGEHTQAQASAVSVPAGSVLIIRASGKAQFDVVVAGGLEEAAGDQRPAPRRCAGSQATTSSGRSTPFRIARPPSRSPRIPNRKRAARWRSPTSSRMTTASPKRTRLSRSRTALKRRRKPRRARRARFTVHLTSRSCCPRRAPRMAPARPSRT
jgi:uncharacterized protein (TIGR02302 family)